MVSTFAATFREIVMPMLKSRARVQGLFLALGRRTFTEAYDEVFGLASARGALHLDDSLLSELEGWIAKELIASCNEFEPQVEERRQIADRVAVDVARCEAAWTTM